jgi:tRNA(Ile)-lysidine synthase TilS/MesJ
VGEAVRRFRLIEEGDKILVGVSGGKDSTSLVKILSEKQKYFPFRFEILAAHVVTDIFPRNEELECRIDQFFESVGVPNVRKFVEVFKKEGETRDINCFYCAMQRRTAMVRLAHETGCNKIAYGHHLDDIVETLLMNMFYKAEISTMPARLELDNHDLILIRPFCMTKESEIRTYAERMGLTGIDGPRCPHGKDGRRARIKKLVSELSLEYSEIRNNLFASLSRVKTGYLTEKIRGEEKP